MGFGNQLLIYVLLYNGLRTFYSVFLLRQNAKRIKHNSCLLICTQLAETLWTNEVQKIIIYYKPELKKHESVNQLQSDIVLHSWKRVV